MPNDTHWVKNPLQTKLQEVIFELHDKGLKDLANQLEEVETLIFKEPENV
jgi:predicted house-cleaning noncanonical NTP pyrophosphatase (MazG superfamily)